MCVTLGADILMRQITKGGGSEGANTRLLEGPQLVYPSCFREVFFIVRTQSRAHKRVHLLLIQM